VKASVEHHAGILLEDLTHFDAISKLTESEQLIVNESLMGLHYVWRVRIHDNLNSLDRDLCERMHAALLLFINQTVLKGPKFISREIPTRSAAMSMAIFCGMVHDVEEFLEIVNKNMTVSGLRRALDVKNWLGVTEIDDDDVLEEGETLNWTYVKFNVQELKRQIVNTVLYLAEVLDTCTGWQTLVHDSAHASFEAFVNENNSRSFIERRPKMVLAPKGQVV
jgi:hypothetical protein